jgi:hypothetical protein
MKWASDFAIGEPQVSGSKKISELTSATVLTGTEIFPIVQNGETRQVAVTALNVFQLVRSVQGLTGDVQLALGDLAGVEAIVSNQGVSAAIGAVSVRVDQTSAALTSVQAFLLAQISTVAGGGITEAPVDGQVYGRAASAWVPVSISALQTQVNAVSVATSVNAARIAAVSSSIGAIATQVDSVSVAVSVERARITAVSASVSALQVQLNAVSVVTSVLAARIDVVSARPYPYDIAFDFGTSTLPQGEYAAIVAGRTFYVLPSCSNSQIAFNTSAFPSANVSIPIMFPTSTTLGILVIGVSGTATWPAIATTSVAAGQTFGVRTSVSSNATLLGLRITFAGYHRA